MQKLANWLGGKGCETVKALPTGSESIPHSTHAENIPVLHAPIQERQPNMCTVT
jgi:hypothetical protein